MYASGKVLRKLIAEHDTSQAAIARATGIQKQNISLICNGKTQYPSIHTCKRIAGFFGLTLDESIGLVGGVRCSASTCAYSCVACAGCAPVRPFGTRLGRKKTPRPAWARGLVR